MNITELESMVFGGVHFSACHKEDVIVGKGHIKAVKLSRTKKVIWVLPGQQVTGEKSEAVYAAEEIDRLIKEARRG